MLCLTQFEANRYSCRSFKIMVTEVIFSKEMSFSNMFQLYNIFYYLMYSIIRDYMYNLWRTIFDRRCQLKDYMYPENIVQYSIIFILHLIFAHGIYSHSMDICYLLVSNWTDMEY